MAVFVETPRDKIKMDDNIKIAMTGSEILRIQTKREYVLPGRAIDQRLMGKDVFFWPACQIQFGTCGQKIKTRLRQVHSIFADQTFIQRVA